MMKRIVTFVGILILAVACGKSNDDSNNSSNHTYGMVNGMCYDYTSQVYTTTASCANNTSYYWSSGSCISAATGQAVNSAYCSTSTANNGYVLSNGICYSTINGQQAPVSYCSATSGTGQCYGTYYYNNNGNMQMGQCQGANCRGMTLIEATTGRQVLCQ
jgi:hypothetical protein